MADKTLLIKLKIAADGTAVVAGVGRDLDKVAGAESRLRGAMAETNREARTQQGLLGGMTSGLGRMLAMAGGVGALSVLAKKTFDYNQELEATKNSISGLLFANEKYVDGQNRAVDSTTAWNAAQADASQLMARLQVESLKTAATVPQIADAFALVYGALQQAGQSTKDLDKLITLTTRLTQSANAFKVPMEQMRQEISSLMTGQITQDSTIAHRLGLTNEDVRRMQANGKLVDELIKRTEAYAKAADAQANTVLGKFVNTAEAVVSTFSRAFDPVIQRMKGGLDGVNTFFAGNGGGITSFVQRAAAGIELVIGKTTEWMGRNRELLEGMVALGAGVVIMKGVEAGVGAVNTALMIATGTSGKFMVTLLAIAAVWEVVHQLQDFEIAGKPLAAYVQWTATVLGANLLMIADGARALAQIVGTFVKEIFRGVMLNFAEIWGKIGELIHSEGIQNAAANAKGFWKADSSDPLGDRLDKVQREMLRVTQMRQDALAIALGAKSVPSISEMAMSGLKGIVGAVDNMLPSLTAAGKKIADALNPDVHRSGASGAAQKLTEAQQKQLTDFRAWLAQIRTEASAAGTDALTEKLAQIEEKRAKIIADARDKAKASQGAIGAAEVGEATALANMIAKRDTASAINEKVVENEKRIGDLRRELSRDAQKDIDDDRIAAIDDALQRELEQNRVANRQWADEKRSSIDAFYSEQIAAAERTAANLEGIDADWARAAAAEMREAIAAARAQESKELDAVETDRERRDKRSGALFESRLREQEVGTIEWARKLNTTLSGQFARIGDIVIEKIADARSVLAGSINGFIDDLASGQVSIAKTLSGLMSGLAATWSKALTNILMNGEAKLSQIRALFGGGVGNPMINGDVSLGNTALSGAGFGSMVGGIFQGPSNYASLGGTIGGALGAVIGTILGGNTILGTMIGTAIGTAIGSLIQKGSDHIKVAIRNVTADSISKKGQALVGDNSTTLDLGNGATINIDEKGISAEARGDLLTQIRRKVREQMHGWQAIIDLFPEEVKKALANWKPTLNLAGGVDAADLTDEGALNSLGDFLGNKLPKAAFSAYEGGLQKAFQVMGVGKERISELFARWGELQGQELQDAVKNFVVTMLEGLNWRDKFRAGENGLSGVWTDAMQPTDMLSTLDDFNSRLAVSVASMSQLTDVDDLIAAQKEINDLTRAKYDYERQAIAQVTAQFQAMRSSNDQLKENIQVSGMGDQEKINFFYKRIADLQTQLAGATDPTQIANLNSDLQRYIQAALGVAPDNAENRTKLMEILDNWNSALAARQDVINQKIVDSDAKTADLLQQAANALMKAADDLSGGGRRRGVDQPGGDPDGHKPPKDGGPPSKTNGDLTDAIDQALVASRAATLDVMTAMRTELLAELSEVGVANQKEADAQAERSVTQIAAAVKAAIGGMELRGTFGDVRASIDTGELVLESADYTIRFIQANPNSIISRTRG